jgi:hypothetical protein
MPRKPRVEVAGDGAATVHISGLSLTHWSTSSYFETLFGVRKKKARENFATHVAAGARLGHNEEFYSTSEDGILGSEEFVDATAKNCNIACLTRISVTRISGVLFVVVELVFARQGDVGQ